MRPEVKPNYKGDEMPKIFERPSPIPKIDDNEDPFLNLVKDNGRKTALEKIGVDTDGDKLPKVEVVVGNSLDSMEDVPKKSIEAQETDNLNNFLDNISNMISERTDLRKENESLRGQNKRLNTRLRDLEEDYEALEKRYSEVMQIMNKVQEMMNEQSASVEIANDIRNLKFRMDRNGNLNKLQ